MSTNTAWGKATVKERVVIPQRAPHATSQPATSPHDARKELASVIELLEGFDGASMIRVAYTTGGRTRRGPVTLRASDLARLRKALMKTPELAAALMAAIPR